MSRPGTRSALFWPANAVKSISATSAREIHRPAASSKMASVYSIGVQTSSLMAVIAFFTAGVCHIVTDTSAPTLTAA